LPQFGYFSGQAQDSPAKPPERSGKYIIIPIGMTRYPIRTRQKVASQTSPGSLCSLPKRIIGFSIFGGEIEADVGAGINLLETDVLQAEQV
jgi:hypothetical protein